MFHVTCCLDHSVNLICNLHIRIVSGTVAGDRKRVSRYCSRVHAGAKSQLPTTARLSRRGEHLIFRRG